MRCDNYNPIPIFTLIKKNIWSSNHPADGSKSTVLDFDCHKAQQKTQQRPVEGSNLPLQRPKKSNSVIITRGKLMGWLNNLFHLQGFYVFYVMFLHQIVRSPHWQSVLPFLWELKTSGAGIPIWKQGTHQPFDNIWVCMLCDFRCFLMIKLKTIIQMLAGCLDPDHCCLQLWCICIVLKQAQWVILHFLR